MRIPRLEPQDGEYVLQVVESLQEVVYFDEAKLIAVDHPEGTEVFPNEMMAVSAPPPSFEVFCIRRPIEPVCAVNHRGVNVTEEIRQIDRRCAGATDPDGRFIAYADDHFVALDSGDRLRRLPPHARLVLFLYGWVEYPYSSTNYAASQAGLRAEAPSIHVLRDGQWVELFGEVTDLLDAADDRFVIMGHGEEVTLRFPANTLGPAPPGLRRTFILKTDSFSKDIHTVRTRAAPTVKRRAGTTSDSTLDACTRRTPHAILSISRIDAGRPRQVRLWVNSKCRW